MANIKQVLEFVITTKQTAPNLSTISKQYKESLQKAQKETVTLNQALRALNVTPMATLKNRADALKTSMDRLKTAYKNGEIAARDYARAQASLKAKMASLKGTSGELSGLFMKMRTSLLGMAAAGYTLAKSFGAYGSFEQKMAEVNTLLNTSKTSFMNLRTEILNLSTQIPQSAGELASAEYDIISAGVKLKNSTSVLKLSAKAAIAGVTDTKTAVNVGVGVINAYGMSIDKLNDVYDTLFMTVKDGVTTFPELAQNIGTVLPVARSAGVEFTDLSAAIAQLTKAGIKTPEAIVGLRGAIVALSSPTAEAKKQMDALGITWKGLIPTIKELTKYADKPDIMRNLIPDVRARMAVLSLANNFDGLNKTLADFENKAGAMGAAYKKMADTPVNKMKIFKNEINKLAMAVGHLVANALLPLLTKVNALIDGFKNLDGPTKTYVEILFGAASAFALWKMGLGSIVSGIGTLMVSMHTTLPIMEAFTGAMTAAKAAAMGGIVVTVVLAGYNLTKLIGEITSLNTVLRQSQRLSQQYTQDAQKYKYAANIQILSKEQLLKLSEQEREKYKKNLVAAMKYYTYTANASRMAATQAKRFLGIPLPFQSEKAKEAQKNAEKLDAETNKIRIALQQLGNSAKPNVANLNKAVESTHPVFMLSVADAKLLGVQLKKAYDDAIEKANEWKNKVSTYEQQIRREKMSTSDLIRSLERKTMSEEEAWYDKKQEADQKMAAAEKALHEGNYELAKKLTKEAKDLYAQLATTVHTTSEDGKKEVSMSLEETTDTAISGIKSASKLMTNILQDQKSKAQDMENTYKKKAINIQGMLNKLTKTQKKDIELSLPNYEQVKKELDALSIDTTKYIHIKYVKDAGAIQPEKHATGGQIAGYGGGDIVPALLEPGEFIIRKEAVKAYGASFIDAINKMRISGVPKFSTGGIVNPVLARWNGFVPPTNLLGNEREEYNKVLAQIQKLESYTGSAITFGFFKEWDEWWKKQQKIHATEISEEKSKIIEQDSTSLNLNLNGKSYPVSGKTSTVNELIAEIEKLKALGYA